MNPKQTASDSLHPPVIAGVPTGGESRGFFDVMQNCTHEKSEIRMMRSCGQIKRQCLQCGQSISNAIRHSEFTKEEIAGLPDFDEELRDSWWKRRDELTGVVAAHMAEQAEIRLTERKAFYYKYIQSDAWKAKRRLVIERERNICEGCRREPIQEVHHMSYDNLGHELLFELKGLCSNCHRTAHGISK